MPAPSEDARWRRRYTIAAALGCVWVLILLVGHGGDTHEAPTEPPQPQTSNPSTTARPTVQHTSIVSTTPVKKQASVVTSPSVGDASSHAATSADVATGGGGGDVSEEGGLVQPLLPKHVLDLLSRSSMIDVMGNTTLNKACPWTEKESKSNVEFMKVWSHLLRTKFPASAGGQRDGSGLLWFLDEGGLIGSSRAGAMANADDDFDFFLILPNQHAPCRPTSLGCTPEEYHAYIHKFLMVFWNAGMCINKFNPDVTKFKSRNRLMYSFQLNRPADVDPEHCFEESKPFAHMHLAMFTKEGKLKTNLWAVGTTHPMDELDLSILLPVRRCRAGPVDAPCPNNITAFLTVRNRGEYRSRSGDGNCLLVRKKWGEARKIGAVGVARKLAACGYNSIVDLADAFEASGYRSC